MRHTDSLTIYNKYGLIALAFSDISNMFRYNKFRNYRLVVNFTLHLLILSTRSQPHQQTI